MTTPAQATSKADRRLDAMARAVSEVMSPVVLAYVTCVTVAVATTPARGQGLLTGLVVATLCAGLPYLILVVSSRRELLSGRHVPDLRERPAVLLGCTLSAIVGFIAAVSVGASRELVSLVVATVVGLAVAAAISMRWKLSIHMAGAAGAVCAVALATTPWVLGAAPVVALLGWARVQLIAHDTGQVVGGALIGSIVTAVSMTLLR